MVDEAHRKELLKSPGLHHLLLSALLKPEALGIPYLEDQSCRSVAMHARVRAWLTL